MSSLADRSKVELGLAITGTVLLLGAQAAVLTKLSDKASTEDVKEVGTAVAAIYVRKDVLDVRLSSLEREIGNLSQQVASSRVEFAQLKSTLR